MECRHCARYDAEADKCRDDKVNPDSWGSAITVANVMGVRAICMFNDYRERLVLSRLEALEQFGKGKARFGGPKRPTRWSEPEFPPQVSGASGGIGIVPESGSSDSR